MDALLLQCPDHALYHADLKASAATRRLQTMPGIGPMTMIAIGAMAVVRWALRKGAAPGTWLAGVMARKPKMLVAIARANKMSRGVWAMLRKDESYRVPPAA